MFEWTTKEGINHSEHAVIITQTAANFFVSEGECLICCTHSPMCLQIMNIFSIFVYFESMSNTSLNSLFFSNVLICFIYVHRQVVCEWWMTWQNTNPSIASYHLPPLPHFLPSSPSCSPQELSPVPFRDGGWEVADLQLQPGLQWEARKRLWTGLPLYRIGSAIKEQWPSYTQNCLLLPTCCMMRVVLCVPSVG